MLRPRQAAALVLVATPSSVPHAPHVVEEAVAIVAAHAATTPGNQRSSVRPAPPCSLPPDLSDRACGFASPRGELLPQRRGLRTRCLAAPRGPQGHLQADPQAAPRRRLRRYQQRDAGLPQA